MRFIFQICLAHRSSCRSCLCPFCKIWSCLRLCSFSAGENICGRTCLIFCINRCRLHTGRIHCRFLQSNVRSCGTKVNRPTDLCGSMRLISCVRQTTNQTENFQTVSLKDVNQFVLSNFPREDDKKDYSSGSIGNSRIPHAWNWLIRKESVSG